MGPKKANSAAPGKPGRSKKATTMAGGAAGDWSYTPRQKVVLTNNKANMKTEPDAHKVTKSSLRARRPTERALQAERQAAIVEDLDQSSSTADGDYNPEDVAFSAPARSSTSKSRPSLKITLRNPPSHREPYSPVMHTPSPSPASDGLSIISKDIHKLFDTMTSDDAGMQIALCDITLPHPDDPTKEVNVPWTSKDLFHFYLLAYSRSAWSMCDLVVDTWIREFQRINSSDRMRIWGTNKSEYFKHQGKPNKNEDDPCLHLHVTSFDPSLLSLLYRHTSSTCGARKAWADAMALCGSWLEHKFDRPGMERHVWPQELVWDVMRSSLRLSRVRRTLKIEERRPEGWCARYHEHGRVGETCYLGRAKEEERNLNKEAKRKSRGDLGSDVSMSDDEGAPPKRVSFATGGANGKINDHF